MSSALSAINGRLGSSGVERVNESLGCGMLAAREGWRSDAVTQGRPDDSCLLLLTQTAVMSHLWQRGSQGQIKPVSLYRPL